MFIKLLPHIFHPPESHSGICIISTTRFISSRFYTMIVETNSFLTARKPLVLQLYWHWFLGIFFFFLVCLVLHRSRFFFFHLRAVIGDIINWPRVYLILLASSRCVTSLPKTRPSLYIYISLETPIWRLVEIQSFLFQVFRDNRGRSRSEKRVPALYLRWLSVRTHVIPML